MSPNYSHATNESSRIGVEVSLWLQSNHPSPYDDHRRGMIPIHPTAVPSWWRTFSHHYERFSNSLEYFLRSSEVERLECAEVLTIDFQNMTRAILDRLYGDVEDRSSTSGRSQWATSARSSSSSSRAYRQHVPKQPQYFRTPSSVDRYHQNPSSVDLPYSSPVYSYSCPSSIGRMTYAQHLEGISLALDALYFLIQAAQDLTDLSPYEIRQQRLDILQLTPHSLKLTELPLHLSTTIYAVIRRLIDWDHALIRKMLGSTLIMGQLEELVEWVNEDGERPYWGLGESVEGLRRIREWRKAKARSLWAAIWDWIIL